VCHGDGRRQWHHVEDVVGPDGSRRAANCFPDRRWRVISDRRHVLIPEIAAEDPLDPRPALQGEFDLDCDDFGAVMLDEREIRPVECVVSVPVGRLSARTTWPR
jgi:hypothetical protein